ncbi:hypothetical protein EMCG_08661 [[Emmonsia] crescens]|uniref:Uncharacterized protein n=1 Tax=[Emmonsia] crescens TaxID=73230 RepID=A0A0G2I4H4_9EURO|nr:hypothetical protein EMCG_08661 [Emmonsia crescens UAMH 3008]
MPGYAWIEEEIAVAIYFASQGVYQRAIPDLLEQRGFSRRLRGVNDKMANIRKDFPELGSPRHWNAEAVDQLLDKLSISNSNIYILLKPSEADQMIVNKYQTGLDLAEIYEVRRVLRNMLSYEPA